MIVWFQLAAVASGAVEVWPTTERDFRHRLDGRAEVVWSYGHLQAKGFVRGMLWHSQTAKIPGNPFNAESNKVFERWHGGELSFGPVGLWVGRRAIEWIAEERDWGPDARIVLERGPPFPSLAYHDGFRFFLEMEGLRIEGPLMRWHALTLPWPDWRVTLDRDIGKWGVYALVEAGGPQPGTPVDVGVSYDLGIHVGVRVGRLAHPGFEEPIERIAVVAEL